MRAQSKVVEGVYVVGGPGATEPDDCLVYLVDCESELTLIDSGLNTDVQPICENIRALGFEPRLISTLIDIDKNMYCRHFLCDRYRAGEKHRLHKSGLSSF